jgi:hypothetical protein
MTEQTWATTECTNSNCDASELTTRLVKQGTELSSWTCSQSLKLTVNLNSRRRKLTCWCGQQREEADNWNVAKQWRNTSTELRWERSRRANGTAPLLHLKDDKKFTNYLTPLTVVFQHLWQELDRQLIGNDIDFGDWQLASGKNSRQLKTINALWNSSVRCAEFMHAGSYNVNTIHTETKNPNWPEQGRQCSRCRWSNGVEFCSNLPPSTTHSSLPLPQSTFWKLVNVFVRFISSTNDRWTPSTCERNIRIIC